jgi:WD40 repeat protein
MRNRQPIGEPMKPKTGSSAQFSPDGQRVVTASDDNTARVWDAASVKPIGELMKHESAVNYAKFSPDANGGDRIRR